MFLFCYFGKFATDNFEQMANSLYEFNWQKLPINLEKNFIIMIENAQKPIHYHGFNVVILNLETFTKVIIC